MVQTSGRGMYTLLPLGLRVLTKIEAIIDDELQAAGCQKLTMPILLSADEWKTTGRWDSTGDELIRVQDRHKGWYCLAPTHEETITALVASEVQTARQLPLRLYQIGMSRWLFLFIEVFRPLIRSRCVLMRAASWFSQARNIATKYGLALVSCAVANSS